MLKKETPKSLYHIKDLAHSTTHAAVGIGATEIVINDGELFPRERFLARVDDEFIVFSHREGNTLFVESRGNYDTPVSKHYTGTPVSLVIAAAHINKIKDLLLDLQDHAWGWQPPVTGFASDPFLVEVNEGARYIIAEGEGNWSGKDGLIAEYHGGGWRFVEPDESFFVKVGGVYHTFTEGQWTEASPVVADDLETDDNTQVLAASQGVVLKQHIDNINAIIQSDDGDLDELQEIVDFIKANREEVSNLSIDDIAGMDTALDTKVDKVDGQGLSDTNYTQAEKDKLAGVEPSHFKGQYVSLEALQEAVPLAIAGDYANVDEGVGQDVNRYVWDTSDSVWIQQLGASAQLSATQIKEEYESNPDTNVFSDIEKDKLDGIALEATKNRDDSENADRVHAHELSDLTGLDLILADKASKAELIDGLALKVDKVIGHGLSETNFTQAEKDKLDGIALDATKNRTDSENADKIHTHVLSDVTGLDLALEIKVSESKAELTDGLALKVDKVDGQGLSDTNYTQAEKDKLDGIALDATKNRVDSENADKIHTHVLSDVTGLETALESKASKTELTDGLALKVDKVVGKDLSDTNFTQEEKDKLAGLESSKFVGLFVSESALPATGSEGEYANVDGGAGNDVYRVIWDSTNSKWVAMLGVSTALTGAQIKQQYESNPDTNAFTNDEKVKLTGIAAAATKNRVDSANADKVHTHTTAQVTGLDAALLTKFDKTGVVQSVGQSAETVMSQKSITDAIANIPSVSKTSAYTVVAADKGKSIDTTSNVTIPASVFTVGDVIVVTNTSATDSTIIPASGVSIRLAGSTKTGTRTLAGYGVATLRMVTSNVWFASGAGLN